MIDFKILEPELKEELKNSAIQKMSFSCSGAGDLFNEFKEKGYSQIIVCGIESHVCVQQTVLDLLANDFQVDVAADAQHVAKTSLPATNVLSTCGKLSE